MALTLPYPSMVFVPLDVLTADEMNQIVANYEFISDQFPIDSDNIDWPTLVAKTIDATTTNTKVKNLNVKLVYNDAGFGIISGTFKMVGDFDYNERLFSIPNKTSQNSGTIVGTFRNVDFGSSGGSINFSTNAASTGLNGWNSIIVPVMLS